MGMIKTAHFLRVDRSGNVWVTDRGNMQAFKFDATGNLLMTLGKKGVTGDNTSLDAFNGMADVAVAKNGDIFADGEGPNTRVVVFSKDGKFIRWWGAKGLVRVSSICLIVLRSTPKGRLYVADRSNNRIQMFDQSGRFWTSGPTTVLWGVVCEGLLFTTSRWAARTSAC